MGLRQRMYELTKPEEFDEFLARHPSSALFKAGACHKTSQGFGYVEETLDPRESIYMAFVRVIESRPVSNAIAEKTGIVHESPQLILFVEGKAVYDVDNWNITCEAVSEALNKHFGPLCSPKLKSSKSICPSDVSVYVDLLENFIQGSLTTKEFEHKWLTTFQMDATPRSSQEFALLNGLFGDVDAALQGGFVQLESPFAHREQVLKNKASQLLSELSR